MRKVILGLIILVILGTGGYFGWRWYWYRVDPKGAEKIGKNLELQKYDFDTLRTRQQLRSLGGQASGVGSEIEILGKIDEIEKRRAIMSNKAGHQPGLNFDTREIRFKSDGKWVSGMMNYHPEKSSLSKVIIMIRGYAEKSGYYVGSGSWKVADALAEQGYTTISLDFLGYGHSEEESGDPLEARFHKVTEVLDLIESVKRLPWVDKNHIGIWAHSNGGQIALSVLEITGQNYPTVLWAPMTNPFPQSLIDTADEGEEKDKAVAFVNSFLKYYDGRRYAFENYYEWIKAPVLIQQGTKDVWCKVDWQEKVIKGIGDSLAKLTVFEEADHNLNTKWQEAVEEDIEFYKNHFIY